MTSDGQHYPPVSWCKGNNYDFSWISVINDVRPSLISISDWVRRVKIFGFKHCDMRHAANQGTTTNLQQSTDNNISNINSIIEDLQHKF